MTFGTAGQSLIAGIPGSVAAVRDCFAVLLPLLPHARHVMSGGDHLRTTSHRGRDATTPVISRIRQATVTEQIIDVSHFERLVADDAAGAVVSFAGVVRDNDGGRQVASLYYEAHPSAQDVLERVTREVTDNADVTAVSVAHRVGDIPIGEAALIVAVSARHRSQAFDACARLVDSIKDSIPVWKHQVFTDGTDEWVNSA
jgi:molybdopterin synthase catalytic subunit